MDFSQHHSLLTDDDSSTNVKQRFHLREYRFVPEDTTKLASTTGKTEPQRFLKTSQAPRTRPQLLAPVKGATPAPTRVDVPGPSPHELSQQPRLSVLPLDGIGTASKSLHAKSSKKPPARGSLHTKKVSPRHTTPHSRFGRRAASLDQASRQGLQIEGSSVLASSPAVALQALEHLSDCVQAERQLRAQLEAAQQAKVAAFRSVIKVFLTACVDESRDNRATVASGAEGVIIARCSVVTNALVVVLQSYIRGIASSLRARSLFEAARSSGRLQQSTQRSPIFRGTNPELTTADYRQGSAFERSLSTTRNLEDLLDMSEINQLKQLYFDFYDCEVVSLGSDINSEFDGDAAAGTRPTHGSASLTSTEEGTI